MRYFALDGSSRWITIGFLDDDAGISSEMGVEMKVRHSRRLLSTVDVFLKNIGYTIKDVDVLGVGVGPGSFTGLRVSIATIKGVGEVIGIPIVPLPTLLLYAMNVPDIPELFVLENAREDNFYGCIYSTMNGRIKEIDSPFFLPLKKIKDVFASYESVRCILIGGIDFRKEIENLPNVTLLPDWTSNIHGSTLTAMTKILYKEGKYTDAKTVEPIYIQKPLADEMIQYKKTGF